MGEFRQRWSITAAKMAVAPVVLIATLVIVFFHTDHIRDLETHKQRERALSELGELVVERLTNQLATDVLLLSRSLSLADYFGSQSDSDLANLAIEFQNLCRFRSVYDQIRFLDESGVETVRVDYHDGACDVIPGDQLQDKSGRYYYSDTFELESGEVFVSPLDLNIERGQIEQPLKPMIRIGTPVHDSLGNKRGIVLINYLAQNLLDAIAETMHSPASDPVLINSDGYFLLAPPGDDAWQFMYQQPPDFATEHPAVWSQMMSSKAGVIESESGDLFAWSTVSDLSEYSLLSSQLTLPSARKEANTNPITSGSTWKAGTITPSSILASWRTEQIKSASILLLILEFLAITAAIVVAKSRAKERATFSALRVSEERSRAVITDLAEGLIVLDEHGQVLMMNPKAEQLLGFSENQLKGQSLHETVHRVTTESQTASHGETCPILQCLQTTQPVEVDDDQFTHRNGHRFPVSYVASPFFFNEKPQGIVVAFQDITERKRIEAQLTSLATRDQLTTLFNRREIEKILEASFGESAQNGTPTIVVMLDVDHFKRINDSHGHPVGDRVLHELGIALAKAVDGVGHVGRYGGEEFLAVVTDLEPEQALTWAEQTRLAVEALSIPIRDSDEPLHFTASIGVAVRNEADESPSQLVTRADQALYQAKTAGRNRVCLAR
jgi:diguanylate cyclase (GGDEF)-like protein/PAS domain S-box-containing protein